MNREASGTGSIYYFKTEKWISVQFHIGPLEFEAAVLKERLVCYKKQAPPLFVICARYWDNPSDC